MKFRQLFEDKTLDKRFGYFEDRGIDENGSDEEKSPLFYASSGLSSTSGGEGSSQPFTFHGKPFTPAKGRGWRTSNEGLRRLDF